MSSEITKNLEKAVEEMTQSFHEAILTLRTSRPSPSLVENISVESYGAFSPLKHLASIAVMPPNIITIEPWDKSLLNNIKKAIETSNLGLSPQIDGSQLRLYLPPLTRERKEELIKILNLKKEEFRVKLRQLREDALENIKELFENKEISEDEKFRVKDEIQKIIDKGNEKLDEYEANKKKEIEES